MHLRGEVVLRQGEAVLRECGGIRWVSVSVRPTWDEATSLDLRDGARDVFARWGKDGSDPDS